MCLSARRLRRYGFLAALMAGDAVIHVESFERRGWRLGQSLHRPVTGLAVYFSQDDMRAMGKKYVGRQTPHSPPGDFLSLLAKRFEFFYFRVFRVAARMTGHAERRRRPSRDRAFLRALMATNTGDVLRDVSLVRKFDGLLDPRHAPIGPVAERQRSDDNCND